MKRFAVIAIIVLILGGGTVWFWSLGNVPDDAPAPVKLRVASANVQVREPKGSDWTSATDGMTIGEGWSVKTDGGGRATIEVADVGETRIDVNSEITLSKAIIDPSGSGAVVELTLSMGRAWTRVLRFFDLGSSYAVKTSAVVATVRGTAFEVSIGANKSTRVAVVSAAVDVQPKGGFVTTTTDAVAGGTVVVYDAVGRPMERGVLSGEERSAPWFNGNLLDDRAFTERAVASRSASLNALGGAPPGSTIAGIMLLSERMHLALAKTDARARLRERYFARRLMNLVRLANEGKAGQAAQEFARLDNEARSSAMSVEDRVYLRQALSSVAPLIESARSDSPLFTFRQRVESLAQSVSDPKLAAGVYARLIAVEDQIVDAERLIEERSLGDARVALDGAASGIANVVRESATLIIGFSKEDRYAIEAKIAALHAREAAARTAIDVVAAGQLESSTSTEPGSDVASSPTSTVPLPSDTAPATSTPTDALLVSSIRVTVTPTTLDIGKKGTLRVVAVLTDGSTADVSAKTVFSAADDRIVHLNGLEMIGLARGSTLVTASYTTASGKTFMSSVTVTVSAPLVPTSLSLTASNGTALAAGQATLFAATVRMSDGTQKLVSVDTVFILEPGSVGTLTGATFSSGNPGSATVRGSYTANGKTIMSSAVITVTGPGGRAGNATSTP